MANIVICEKRSLRLNQLAACIGVPKDLSEEGLHDLASRIINNMAMTIEQQENYWKVPLKSLLRRPLPYDDANPFKPSIYLEMMPSVGKDILHKKIWAQLERAFNSGPQSGKFLALLVGVSGMGKTKAAYDIGKESTFGIINRIVERDALTPPWVTFVKILDNALHLEITEVSEKCSMVACLILLMIAHLQFVVDVSSSAIANTKFKELVSVRMDELQCDEKKAKDLIMKEVVLRCQRNGLAFTQVNSRFQRLLHQTIHHPGFLTAEGVLQIQFSYAIEILRDEVNRSKTIWGNESKIVWFYDEIQASLNLIQTNTTFFSGVFQHISGSQAVALDHIPQATAQSNLFFGILVAIRKMLEHVSHGHVLLGNNMLLTDEVLARNSPAQGCCETYEENFHLNEDDILQLLGVYLSDAAMAVVDRSLIRKLGGRPLFMSHFWTCLLQCAGTLDAKSIDSIGDVVNKALDVAYKSAVADAKFRINRMWNDYSRNAHSATSSGGLMALLFHSIVMNSGGGGFQPMQMELKEAIVRGILNCTGSEYKISLENEPVTKNAFMFVGQERLLLKTDGVMELLAARLTRSMGNEKCDMGEVLEACFSWYLVRQCIIAEGPIILKTLLSPFLATHPSCNQVAEQLEDYEVSINFGHRCDPSDAERSPFSILKNHLNCLIHHPDNSMAGPDIIHIARHRRDTQLTIPILYQLKNRETGTIGAAMESLNLGRMHPNRKGGETPAHLSMRVVLEQDNNWLAPIRVLVASRNFEPAVLHHVAWFNMHQWERSPLVLLTVSKENLGIDIAADMNASYGPPRDWATLWPSNVKHSILRSPVETIQSNLCRVSLSVKISWNLISLQSITKNMILTKIYALTDNADVTRVVKLRGFPSMIIEFAQIADAFKIVKIKEFSIGDKKMSCEFYI